MKNLDAKSPENDLVQSCIDHRPFAWQQFSDRYLPVVLKTVQQIDTQASHGWTEDKHQQLVTKVFETLQEDDFQLLRNWDNSADFETYLIIVTRRVALGQNGQTGKPTD